MGFPVDRKSYTHKVVIVRLFINFHTGNFLLKSQCSQNFMPANFSKGFRCQIRGKLKIPLGGNGVNYWLDTYENHSSSEKSIFQSSEL